MERAHENFFLKSAALLLGVTAAAKLLSAAGPARILDYPDPIFVITNRAVMTGACGFALFPQEHPMEVAGRSLAEHQLPYLSFRIVVSAGQAALQLPGHTRGFA